MARFLMIPHAPIGLLAHLTACAAVAGALRDRGHEPVFAYGGSRPELLERAGFDWHPVVEAQGPMHWEWFENPDHLEKMVSSQVDLVERLNPAALVTSAGFGRITAELTDVPELTLMHSVASTRYGRSALRAWMLRDAARHPTRLIAHLRARRRRPGSAAVIESLAEVLRRHGLAPLSRGTLVARAELVACVTAPFLDPTLGLPPHWHYVGPLDYGTADCGPVGPASARNMPRVYISQGSSGSAELLRRAVEEVTGEGWRAVVSTGGLADPDKLNDAGPSVTAASILDTRAELEAADVAVIAGGNMTAMQALLAGTPTVVVPHTRQQSAGALRAERLGTGLALWPRVGRGAIARTTRRVLQDRRYTDRARRFAAELMTEWNGNGRAAALAEALIERTRK